MKHYNLALDDDVYDEVRGLAESKGTTMVEVLRRFVRLGLLAVETQESGGSVTLRLGSDRREVAPLIGGEILR